MNPNAQQPSFELPPLPSESAPVPSGLSPEVGVSKENAPVLSAAQPLPIPDPTLLQQGVQPIAIPAQPVGNDATTSSLVADDNDLIEKEWIVRAKQIVAATREDPHAQNRELSKIKADYLKKRYGKDIKVDGS